MFIADHVWAKWVGSIAATGIIVISWESWRWLVEHGRSWFQSLGGAVVHDQSTPLMIHSSFNLLALDLFTALTSYSTL